MGGGPRWRRSASRAPSCRPARRPRDARDRPSTPTRLSSWRMRRLTSRMALISAQVVVRPDDDRDAGLPEGVGRRRVVHGGYDDERRAAAPLAAKARISSAVWRLLWMRMPSAPAAWYASARRSASSGPARRWGPPRGDDREVGVAGAVLAGLDLAAEFVDVGQRLMLADERVGLGKELVLEGQTAATPRWQSFRTRRRTLLKLP